MKKELILSMLQYSKDPYRDFCFERDDEGPEKGLVRFEDADLGWAFEWYRDKSNDCLRDNGFSFYYARWVYADPYTFPTKDVNNPNPEEDRYLQIGKPYGLEDEPLLTVVDIQYVSEGSVHIISSYETGNEYYKELYKKSVLRRKKANAAFERNVDWLAKQMGYL